jgi:ApaG protein
MRAHTLALTAVLAVASVAPYVDAFTPASLQRSTVIRTGQYEPNVALFRPLSPLSRLNMSNFIGMDDDDDEEDEDEEDEDDDEYIESSGLGDSGATSPFTGLKLDPYDPNPLIKPRPSDYFPEDFVEEAIPDDQIVQTMTKDERVENLTQMRQLQKIDLPDLHLRRDHAGYLEAQQDFKNKSKKDPWFGLNDRLRDAIQFGKPEAEIAHIKTLMEKVDGPPGDVEIGWRGYAEQYDIYKYEATAASSGMKLEYEMRKERAARGKAMMLERKENEKKEKVEFEEDMRYPGLRREREAKGRREAMLARVMTEIDADRKKLEEKAKDMLGRLPEAEGDSIKNSLDLARADLLREKKRQSGEKVEEKKEDDVEDDEDDDSPAALRAGKKGSSAEKAREAAAAEASGGRPRMPGDKDVTRGELSDMKVESASSTVTGPVQVEVTSVYNKEQSDPPMRKHCFQYTIRITNSSPTDSIQLLGRRFEIQTVGSSMKDVVQGEGVTGRQPILKPGEVFEYTSTAPLSVRPIGTTEIAARMQGEYRFVTLTTGQETATEEQVKSGGDASAALGMFHFIFPTDQRVVPFKRSEDETDEDDEDDEVVDKPPASVSASKPATAAKPVANPASSLPGDEDMKTGSVSVAPNDTSDTVTDNVRVQVTSSYRPERSDSALDKHCFAYNIRITNESEQNIQLVSRRFEIQTIGSTNKDVVQGPGVTGRQPILKPGESFEYTSTAPLSVKPMDEKTPIVARMQGEYNFVSLGEDGVTPLSSTPLQAKLGVFHFVLPALEGV